MKPRKTVPGSGVWSTSGKRAVSVGVAGNVSSGDHSEGLRLTLLCNLLRRPEVLEKGLRILTVARAESPGAIQAQALDAAHRPLHLLLVHGPLREEHVIEATSRTRNNKGSAAGASPSSGRVLVVSSGNSVSPRVERAARGRGAELWQLQWKPEACEEVVWLERVLGPGPAAGESLPAAANPPTKTPSLLTRRLSPDASDGSGRKLRGTISSPPLLTAEEIDSLLGPKLSDSPDRVTS